MADIKGKVADAGHAVAETAKSVGHKTDVGVSGIKERMDVIASCGKKVGVVDHVESGTIKLTKKDSPDDQHHFIPFAWVDRVDSRVHLKKNSKETEEGWKSDAASCGCC